MKWISAATIAALLAGLMAGCASSKGTRIIGEVRPPLLDHTAVAWIDDVDQVPANAEQIALLHVALNVSRMGDEGVRVMRERLLKKAASVGANAVVIKQSPPPPRYNAGSGNYTISTAGFGQPVALVALAIWLPPDA